MEIPSETYLPLVLAVGVAVVFVGLLVQTLLVGIVGAVIAAVGLLRWTWRTAETP